MDHNLAIDQRFNTMHLILCRNVLIYFNRKLQNRVISLFNESLYRSGFLCLGSKESLLALDQNQYYYSTYGKEKIYRKKMIYDPNAKNIITQSHKANRVQNSFKLRLSPPQVQFRFFYC